MEDALRGTDLYQAAVNLEVLILVLMEDALREGRRGAGGTEHNVLILVLMEDALRAVSLQMVLSCNSGLNPCSNGRCSARAKLKTY